MGILRDTKIVEQRAYDHPDEPETSEYDLLYSKTSTDAVLGQNGKLLNETLTDINDRLASIGARLFALELLAGGEVESNPFTVTFSDLDDVEVDGVWVEAQARLEF